MGQGEVKALTGGQPAAIDQAMLSIKVITIDAHLQTAAGSAGHSQACTITEALVGIEIPEQDQRSPNTKLDPGAGQVGGIQTTKKLSCEFFVAGQLGCSSCGSGPPHHRS